MIINNKKARSGVNPGNALFMYKFIGEISVPMLDIYGEEDLEDVRRGIDDRRLAANKNGNNDFQQIELQGSGHHFLEFEDILIEQIQIWLESMTLVMDETAEISDISPEILHENDPPLSIIRTFSSISILNSSS